MGTVILGTGSCVPKREMTNIDLESVVDTNDEWIRTRTGIESRRVGGPGEKTYQLASSAARKALEMAGVTAEEIDLLIVGTISSHMIMPSTACFVQNEIGALNAFAYDVNAACSGFLYGLDIADKQSKIEAKNAETAKKMAEAQAQDIENQIVASGFDNIVTDRDLDTAKKHLDNMQKRVETIKLAEEPTQSVNVNV